MVKGGEEGGRYLISQHPEVEARIMEELDGLGLLVTEERPSPRELEYADISKLTYLAAVMKATPPPSLAGATLLLLEAGRFPLLSLLPSAAFCSVA